MSLSILGISAFYHDSAAAVVKDGQIVAAAQEERFTRIKHDHNFPKHAVDYCLQEAGLTPEQLDYVVFYDKPFLKFERLLETYLAFAPRGFRSFMMAMPLWLKTKLHLPREIRKALDARYRKRIAFTGHHESHAASAFFPSPFEEAAILTMDGVGEWDTATIGSGKGNKIKLLKTLHFPHSLGLLYSAFTYFCGFKVNSGEYKLMGLAPYGEPRYADLILEKLVDLQEDGSLAMDMRYFNYCAGLTMTGKAMERLFGGPPRKPEAMITQREMDLAASIQKVTEEVVLRMARTARNLTGARNLCLAGGVALNCVANGKLLRSGIFEDILIQPAAGDAGGALGAALFVHHQLLDRPRATNGADTHARLLARAVVQQRGDSPVPRRPWHSLPVLRRRGRIAEGHRRGHGRRQGGRLVPGADGVRPARARRAQHHRRRPQRGDAGDDEPAHQVPRILPALRAVRAGGGREPLFRARPPLALHAARRRRAQGIAPRPDARAGAPDERPGPAQAGQCPALQHPRHHARGYVGPRADAWTRRGTAGITG